MSLPSTAIFGFSGGNNIFKLGRQQDMVVFFSCLDNSTRLTLGEKGRSVLLDRLFKRYLREEDLDEAVLSMNLAKEQFQHAIVKDVDLIQLGLEKNHTLLHLIEGNLAEIFEKYFLAFSQCVSSYRRGKAMFGYYYNPVKVSRIDLPGLAEDDARSLKAYDDLVGPPFWFPRTRKVPAGEPWPPTE